jgi:hypothetical protein
VRAHSAHAAIQAFSPRQGKAKSVAGGAFTGLAFVADKRLHGRVRERSLAVANAIRNIGELVSCGYGIHFTDLTAWFTRRPPQLHAPQTPVRRAADGP